MWITESTQDKSPDVLVSCVISEECVLPCSFQPSSNETVEWLRLGVLVYRLDQGREFVHQQLSGRAQLFPHLVTRGNATLIIRRSILKDRGAYTCRVQTAAGEHQAKVVLKVEAPIRRLFLETSRLSGYEEMKCVVRDVFPPPRVTWVTEPPTFERLRPLTRMLADKNGLYTVDSRLRKLGGQPNLLYICRVSTSYSDETWTASLQEREIRGSEGKDLSLPCSAPSYLSNPILRWSFSNGDDSSHILTYDSRSGSSVSTAPWDSRVELDGFRVPFGDGSLRLMDPQHAEHTGSFTCVFSMPCSTHTERNLVTFDTPAGQRSESGASHWWILGVLILLLVLGLGAGLLYMKLRGKHYLSNDSTVHYVTF
uniref:Ig-like domain-containing protein n=1 Tax=Gouania willdenowi TaxID=441366 RepID=A0A8C5GV51_GOUWI